MPWGPVINQALCKPFHMFCLIWTSHWPSEVGTAKPSSVLDKEWGLGESGYITCPRSHIQEGRGGCLGFVWLNLSFQPLCDISCQVLSWTGLLPVFSEPLALWKQGSVLHHGRTGCAPFFTVVLLSMQRFILCPNIPVPSTSPLETTASIF